MENSGLVTSGRTSHRVPPGSGAFSLSGSGSPARLGAGWGASGRAPSPFPSRYNDGAGSAHQPSLIGSGRTNPRERRREEETGVSGAGARADGETRRQQDRRTPQATAVSVGVQAWTCKAGRGGG